jgi:hypothetical protein
MLRGIVQHAVGCGTVRVQLPPEVGAVAELVVDGGLQIPATCPEQVSKRCSFG